MDNPIITLLCSLSGTRRDALERSPAGRGQAATLGFLLVATATLAALNAGYALRQAFLGTPGQDLIAVGGGLIWGGIIFSIDRILVSGIDRSAPWWRLAAQVLARVPLAGIIAAVISTPLLLHLCEAVIERALMAESRDLYTRESTANADEAGLPGLRTSAAAIKTEVEQQRERLRGEPDSARWIAARDGLSAARSEEGAAQAKSDRDRPALAAEWKALRRVDPRTPAEEQRLDLVSASLSTLDHALATARGQTRQAEEEQRQARNEWQRAEEARLKELEASLTRATTTAGTAEAEVARRNQEDAAEIAQVLRPNLVNQYRVLRRVTDDPENPDGPTIRSFETGLDLVFFLLEMTPILLKAYSRRTPLDDAVAACEMEESESIVVATNGRLGALWATRDTELAAVAAWKQAALGAIQATGPTVAELERHLHEIRAWRARQRRPAGP